ncbi:hypothetical protein F511_15211 [Dorcoceras hygrometricum]|uniref:Uncharacterized protein n=1 Tax=Dorcoceras hygrometricum TaxID=472368 RepID=A0A2Z7CAT4_9LAMI|nr:hypothetical protein F511_15211 [Dorcoceras hygrometricum]
MPTGNSAAGINQMSMNWVWSTQLLMKHRFGRGLLVVVSFDESYLRRHRSDLARTDLGWACFELVCLVKLSGPYMYRKQLWIVGVICGEMIGFEYWPALTGAVKTQKKKNGQMRFEAVNSDLRRSTQIWDGQQSTQIWTVSSQLRSGQSAVNSDLDSQQPTQIWTVNSQLRSGQPIVNSDLDSQQSTHLKKSTQIWRRKFRFGDANSDLAK